MLPGLRLIGVCTPALTPAIPESACGTAGALTTRTLRTGLLPLYRVRFNSVSILQRRFNDRESAKARAVQARKIIRTTGFRRIGNKRFSRALRIKDGSGQREILRMDGRSMNQEDLRASSIRTVVNSHRGTSAICLP